MKNIIVGLALLTSMFSLGARANYISCDSKDDLGSGRRILFQTVFDNSYIDRAKAVILHGDEPMNITPHEFIIRMNDNYISLCHASFEDKDPIVGGKESDCETRSKIQGSSYKLIKKCKNSMSEASFYMDYDLNKNELFLQCKNKKMNFTSSLTVKNCRKELENY